MLIGIVADDLTGAADSIAPFAAYGLRADVGFSYRGKLREEMPEGDARAWTTETREMPAERNAAIARLTRAAARRLKAFSPRLFYKKIDSSLRGHLRLELDAMRIELPNRLAVVCPAFPANGRAALNGVLHVRGVPKQSVRAAFSMRDDPTAAEMNLHQLRNNSIHVLEHWHSLHREGVQTVFCDAQTSEDLDTLASAVVQQPECFLPVGSAGLSAALARQLLPDTPIAPPPAFIHKRFSEGKVLIVVGSLNQISREQARFLAEKANLNPIVVGNAEGFVDYSQLAQQRFDLGERIVLLQSEEEKKPHRAERIEAGLTYIAAMRMENPDLCLIATGGDTAAAILSNLAGCPGMTIIGESSPGVVVGHLYGIESFQQHLHNMPVIVKAGGFGTEETLARCVGLTTSGQ